MMANTDFHLQFQEFEDESNAMGSKSQETTINIEKHISKPQKQRRVAGVTLPEEENDPLETDDKTKLLSGQKERAPFWTFEYYQAFFDVETHQVKDRIIGSVLPWPGKNFVRVYIRNNPDLYGPFWICATLVFAIGISGNMSSFFVHHGQPQYKYVPDFRKVTMAATAIYSYAWLVPLVLWGFLAWRNNKVTNIVTYSFLEIVCVYGYSLAIYVPAVVLWIIPSEGLRWCSIVVALCLSGSVLVLTFWPAVRDDRPRIFIAITFTIVALHVLLAVGCKAYFFSTYDTTNTIKVVEPVEVNKTLSAIKAH
ncbi:protein YIPF1 isoform X1 [Electrophorus electricus]|uniref:Protein YIPF n=2 Tax=Electrophorus electricus TaxID=8005 RepID=A0A4W4EWA2_ELEEL|nr:protein YIPF1 isoform X1 [Electrophorus electricus]XP_026864407.2 protein YIPF1 isoform X1 [Electrophorus electricus]XP_026864408.2 protein YIPF1 isoform X1 [Electrophorus electricus]XP_026864409.2 protein YIPF1 isoform X1 [Electrophorus electricus]XP_026864410.2 protein YIPF1 isoform X1 [Electrophorus electricus]XP_026864411.2 protein YIPF1 isoform X1 [Electrophorus electricus]